MEVPPSVSPSANRSSARALACALASLAVVGAGWAQTEPATSRGADLSFFLRRLRSVDHLPELDRSHTAMSSTWDRSGGNKDGADFRRIEGNRNVLLDVDGPGCIHRIFTGKLGSDVSGTGIRIILDGAPAPVFDMPVAKFLDFKNGPLPYPLVFHKTYPGTLFPIPFAKHCLVELVNPEGKNWGCYWQLTWTRYGEGARVKSLSWPLSGTEREELGKTARAWLAAESGPPPAPKAWTIERSFSLKEGDSAKVELTGCGVIRELRVSVEPSTPEVLGALRMRAFWDGRKAASVDVPVGYFFGHGDYGRPAARFSSLLLGVTEAEACSRFPMPFARGAVLSFENRSAQAIKAVRVRVDAEKLPALPFDWGRFHATWEERWGNRHLAPKFQRRRVHVVLDRSGFQGKYVGVLLRVHSHSRKWWGEGDWLIWTDESGWPPSYHGTGSEEYFNCGWCRFDRKAVSGCVKTRPGPVAVYSFHLNDAFQFRKSIRVAQETWVDGQPLWGSTAFWYALPSQRARSKVTGIPSGVRAAGGPADGGGTLIEGEHTRVRSHSRGGLIDRPIMRIFHTDRWSNDAVLRWGRIKPDHTLVLEFDAPRPGRYRAIVWLSKSPYSGIHQLSLSGRALGRPVDLWATAWMLADPLDAGVVELARGGNILTVKPVGVNPRSRGNEFALDAIVLKKPE